MADAIVIYFPKQSKPPATNIRKKNAPFWN